MELKAPGLIKHVLIHGIFPFKSEVSVQGGDIVFNISHWTTKLMIQLLVR